jgi:ABC-2 type transport system permease protein
MGIHYALDSIGTDEHSAETTLDRRDLLEDPIHTTLVPQAAPNPIPLKPGQNRLERIKQRGILRVGYRPDNLPYSYFNQEGKLVGLDIDLAARLARDLNVGLELVGFRSESLAQQLADDHFDGKVAMSLIKPTKYIYEVFFRNLGNNFVGNLIISLPLIIVLTTLSVTTQTEVNFTVMTTLLYVISILLALLISFFSNFIFATMVFITDATFGMMQLNEAVVRIFSGSLIPLSFFPPWLKTIAYVLPYASVYTVPTLILMNRYSTQQLWISLLTQLAWAIGLIIGANLIWSLIISKLKVHGG